MAAPSAPPQGGALFLCLLRPPASPVKGCAASGRHRLVAVSRNAPMTKARHPVNARVRTGPPAIRPAPLLLLPSPSTPNVASDRKSAGQGQNVSAPVDHGGRRTTHKTTPPQL